MSQVGSDLMILELIVRYSLKTFIATGDIHPRNSTGHPSTTAQENLMLD